MNRRRVPSAILSFLAALALAACPLDGPEPESNRTGGMGGIGASGGASGTGEVMPERATVVQHPIDVSHANDAAAPIDAAASQLDAGPTGAGPDAAAEAAAVEPYTGMCASARWSTVSESCWSCWCTACADTLNASTRRSMEIFECMFDEELLVGNLFELLCEVRAGQQACVGSSTDDWNKLVAFDMCLMGKATLPAFRACEVECDVQYPGDVCARYP